MQSTKNILYMAIMQFFSGFIFHMYIVTKGVLRLLKGEILTPLTWFTVQYCRVDPGYLALVLDRIVGQTSQISSRLPNIRQDTRYQAGHPTLTGYWILRQDSGYLK